MEFGCAWLAVQGEMGPRDRDGIIRATWRWRLKNSGSIQCGCLTM